MLWHSATLTENTDMYKCKYHKDMYKDLSRVKAGCYKRSSSTLYWICWASQCGKVARNSKYSEERPLLKPDFTLLRSLQNMNFFLKNQGVWFLKFLKFNQLFPGSQFTLFKSSCTFSDMIFSPYIDKIVNCYSSKKIFAIEVQFIM